MKLLSNFPLVTQDNFQNKVLDEKIPVMVEFSTDGCGPCIGIIPLLEELQEELEGKLIIKNLHVTTEEGMNQSNEIAEKYKVMGYPTLLVFKDGEPVEHIIGVYDRETILERLEGII